LSRRRVARKCRAARWRQKNGARTDVRRLLKGLCHRAMRDVPPQTRLARHVQLSMPPWIP
jgi:hypothetical protein